MEIIINLKISANIDVLKRTLKKKRRLNEMKDVSEINCTEENLKQIIRTILNENNAILKKIFLDMTDENTETLQKNILDLNNEILLLRKELNESKKKL